MSANDYQKKYERMKELIDILKEADTAYYRDDAPTMTDREYDQLMDELKDLEGKTGLRLSGSPTNRVSGEILEELEQVRHMKPNSLVLSLQLPARAW